MSGTQPLMRVMVECEDDAKRHTVIERLIEVAQTQN